MTFMRFRPGYAISLHESDADVVAGPSYLTRLPLDPVEEAAIIQAWQEKMDEATFANYQDDEAQEDAESSDDVVSPPTVP